MVADLPGFEAREEPEPPSRLWSKAVGFQDLVPSMVCVREKTPLPKKTFVFQKLNINFEEYFLVKFCQLLQLGAFGCLSLEVD